MTYASKQILFKFFQKKKKREQNKVRGWNIKDASSSLLAIGFLLAPSTIGALGQLTQHRRMNIRSPISCVR